MKNFRFLVKAFYLSFALIVLSLLDTKAHELNQSYVYLRIYKTEIVGRIEYHYKDLNKILDLNFSFRMNEDDLKPHRQKILDFVKEHLHFKSELGPHEIELSGVELKDVGGSFGNYIIVNYKLSNTSKIPDNLEVSYDGVFEKIPTHQGWLMVEYNWKAGIVGNEAIPSVIFSKGDTQKSFTLSKSTIFNGFLAMIKMGIWHIWIGLDHILFLLALILPSVLILMSTGYEVNASTQYRFKAAFTNFKWAPVLKFGPALRYIIGIITFFTIAHTITLSLAALEILTLPSRLVESVIAISIALAALHNLKPIIRGRDWMIAFGFGLFHGFGFAGVLAEGGLEGEYMVLSLLGFNLGVEIGQVLIICAMFPVLYFLRNTKAYAYILNIGSVLLILMSLHWFIERAFEYNIPYRSVLPFLS